MSELQFHKKYDSLDDTVAVLVSLVVHRALEVAVAVRVESPEVQSVPSLLPHVLLVVDGVGHSRIERVARVLGLMLEQLLVKLRLLLLLGLRAHDALCGAARRDHRRQQLHVLLGRLIEVVLVHLSHVMSLNSFSR